VFVVFVVSPPRPLLLTCVRPTCAVREQDTNWKPAEDEPLVAPGTRKRRAAKKAKKAVVSKDALESFLDDDEEEEEEEEEEEDDEEEEEEEGTYIQAACLALILRGVAHGLGR
jgi:TATA-binding protein-associated factor Taf7